MDLSLLSLSLNTFKFLHLLLLASTKFHHLTKTGKGWSCGSVRIGRIKAADWERERDGCHTQPQAAHSPGPVSHAALGYFNSSGGWCYLKLCIFCVPSGPIVRPAGKKTPHAPDGNSITGHIPNEAFSIPFQSVTLLLPSNPLSHLVLVSSPLSLPTHTQLTTALLSNQAEQAKTCGSQRH